MVDVPTFRKPDRYKASSYRSYNFKMPACYDACIWVKGWAPRWDRTIVCELLPEISSTRILDVGCATGRLLLRLAEAGAKKLSGVDLAPRILEVAAEKLARTGISVELRAADAEDFLPWDDESFDVVTLVGVLHHFFRPKDALGEVRRVLRSGGRLLIMDPCFFTPVRQILNAAFYVSPHDGDYHFHSARQAVRLLADVGFTCVRKHRAGFGAFFAVALKPSSDPRERLGGQGQSLPNSALHPTPAGGTASRRG